MNLYFLSGSFSICLDVNSVPMKIFIILFVNVDSKIIVWNAWG